MYIYIYTYTDRPIKYDRKRPVYVLYMYLLISMYINERRLLFRVSGLCSVVVYLVGRFDWKIGNHNGRTKGSEYSWVTQLEQNRSLLRTTSRGEKNVSVCIVASAFCLASPFVRLLLFEYSQNLRCLCKLYEKEKRNHRSLRSCCQTHPWTMEGSLRSLWFFAIKLTEWKLTVWTVNGKT